MNDAGTASFGTAAAVIGFARVAPDGDSRETHSVASHPTKYDEGIAIMKRSNRLVAIVATVALASVSSLALAQEAQVALGTAQTEEIDGWTGAVLATEGGQFARCSVESPDEDGTAMRLELAADGDLVLTLTADRWSLDTDSRVSLSFWLDRGAPQSVSATATGPKSLRLEIPVDFRLVQQLQVGRTLYVLNRGVQTEFGLRNSAQSLQWLYRCVERNSDETFENVLFEEPSEEEKQQQAERQRREVSERVALAEAAALLANILSSATVDGFRISVDRDVDSGISWVSPEANGSLALISEKEMDTLDDIRAELVGAAAVSCGGTFSSQRHDNDTKDYMLVRTECGGGSSSETKLLAAVETVSGGALMLIEARGETVPVVDQLLEAIRATAAARAKKAIRARSMTV
jgi:hypothetical protein